MEIHGGLLDLIEHGILGTLLLGLRSRLSGRLLLARPLRSARRLGQNGRIHPSKGESTKKP